MKHTILIFSQAMELGGVERSLLGLLDAIDYDRYDVDLFLMRHSGELIPYLNPKANLLPELPQYASLAVPMVSLIKKGQFGVLCGRLKGKLAAGHFDKQHPGEKPSIARVVRIFSGSLWMTVPLTIPLNWCAIGRAATADLRFNTSTKETAGCTLPITWPMPISTQN